MNISKSELEKYLKKRYGKSAKILKYGKLGSGWHGTGHKVDYSLGNKKKTVIVRALTPFGFSHDYSSDRAKVFLFQQEFGPKVDKHIKTYDVCGMTSGGIVSLGDCIDYFQIVEEATGKEYVHDVLRILDEGKLLEKDRKRAAMLGNYVAGLHKKRFKGSKELGDSLKRRHTRDVVGHGEMLMGVVDTYPKDISSAIKRYLTEIVKQAVVFREKVKDIDFPLVLSHGDLHPGNIMFDKGKLMILDASRVGYGDPADDIAGLTINYIWFALKHKGAWRGPFRELYDIFLSTYLKKSGNVSIFDTLALHYSFRSVVVAHPVFMGKQPKKVIDSLYRFALNSMKKKRFDPDKIGLYLK